MLSTRRGCRQRSESRCSGPSTPMRSSDELIMSRTCSIAFSTNNPFLSHVRFFFILHPPTHPCPSFCALGIWQHRHDQASIVNSSDKRRLHACVPDRACNAACIRIFSMWVIAAPADARQCRSATETMCRQNSQLRVPISAMFSSVRYCRSLGAASLQSTQLLASADSPVPHHCGSLTCRPP